MPASGKRKEERAKAARDYRRLAIIYYSRAFGTKIALDAQVDLLQSLLDDAADYESLQYLQQSMSVADAAMEQFLDHLCAAAEQKRALEDTEATGDQGEALRYLTAGLQASIEKAYHIAGLIVIDAATCRLYFLNTDLSTMAKVPREIPMLQLFRDTRRAYEHLKEALAEHTELCQSLGVAYATGLLNDDQKGMIMAALDEVWRQRANQLVHATVKAQFFEFAQKFFDDRDAHGEAIRILVELEEGFREPWEHVVASEELLANDQTPSVTDEGESTESGHTISGDEM
jgi:hypothetical protein